MFSSTRFRSSGQLAAVPTLIAAVVWSGACTPQTISPDDVGDAGIVSVGTGNSSESEATSGTSSDSNVVPGSTSTSASSGETNGGTTGTMATTGKALDGDGSSSSSGSPGSDSTGAGASDGDSGTNPIDDCAGLEAIIRDFTEDHADFETYSGNRAYTGLVLPDLGADETPQYNPDYSDTPMITNAETFAQWYHDEPGVNEAFTIVLDLEEQPDGTYVFEDSSFFPLDGLGFGNQGNPHNFHFTTEVHTRFKYEGGEIFTFRGDDDVWMFIDGKLALDLGGLHPALEQSVDIDALGLEVGKTYSMDIFHAERHTNESNFKITTTIDCFIPVAG